LGFLFKNQFKIAGGAILPLLGQTLEQIANYSWHTIYLLTVFSCSDCVKRDVVSKSLL